MRSIKNLKNDYASVDVPINAIQYTAYKSRKGVVCDNIISFDIETSSGFMDKNTGIIEGYSYDKPYEYYKSKVKVSLCYIWQCAIEDGNADRLFYGRTLESFVEFLSDLSECIGDIKIIIYVHNLSFETQFLRNVLPNMEMFARKKRKPIYFRWQNFEFRCSYMLTRLSLAKWASSEKLSHQKLVGNLDYTILRTPKSILWDFEFDYAFEDVLIMNEGLRKYRTRFGSVEKIPITQTGIVRREFNEIMKNENNYHERMVKLLPESLEEYREQVHVFAGGLTRADRFYTDRVIGDVMSRDSTSAYPWHMLDKKYPMTKYAPTEFHERYMNSDKYSYIIEVEFWKIKSRYWNTYLSAYKCSDIKGAVLDNGRVLEADYLRIKCINIDYEIIKKSYSFIKENVISFKYAINDYLPDTFQLLILKLFGDKTSLSGVDEDSYAKAKEFINACFGMLCMKRYVDEVTFSDIDGWDIDFLNEKSFLEKIAKDRRKLNTMNTYYMHGVLIPAYQRASLWECVYELDEDILYMDTDSVKHINYNTHNSFFDRYNNNIRERQQLHADRLGVPVEMFRPVSPKGVVKSLGEYAIEEVYKNFVTLGAKRYAYEDSKGELHITVSGVSKKAVSQLNSIHDFTDGYFFDEEHSGKMIMHYNDNQPICVFNKGKYDEWKSEYLYGLCAQPTGYSMDLTKSYRELVEKSRYAITRILREGHHE